MSRQKGTPNKSKEVMTRGQLPPERTPAPNKPNVEITKEDVKNFLPPSGKDILSETMPKYFILEEVNKKHLEEMVIYFKDMRKCVCVGGFFIHDIRNPLTNEYEPHYYQAMEKVYN